MTVDGQTLTTSSFTCSSETNSFPPIPQCVPKKCFLKFNGADFPHVTVSAIEATVGSVITFGCDSDGYYLTGSTSATCMPELSFNAPIPTCTPRACGPIFSPNMGFLSAYSANYGDVIVASCFDGYAFGGTQSQIYVGCNVVDSATGALNYNVSLDSISSCDPRACSTIPPIPNGSATSNTGVTYDYVFFNCDSGYTMNFPGDSAPYTQCLPDGTWSPAGLPTCVGASCPAPAIQNGMVSYSSLSFQSTVTYTCNAGYKFSGSTEASITGTCQADGSWSVVPACIPSGCAEIFAPNGGVFKLNGVEKSSVSLNAGQAVTVSCNKGYTLTPSSTTTLTCLENGAFDKTMPSCIGQPCPALPAIAHGTYNPSNPALRIVGTSVNVICDKWYTATPSVDNIRCAWDNTANKIAWSQPNNITCVAPACPALSNPTNGQASALSGRVADTVSFTCNQGYELTGASSVVCNLNAQTGAASWSAAAPTCLPKRCTATLAAPTNGTVNATVIVTGQSALYSCSTGYRLVGTAITTCLDTGAFSSAAPTCQAVSCGTLTAPTNGVTTKTSGSYPDTAVLSCSTGYVGGPVTVTCGANGLWAIAPTAPTQPSLLQVQATVQAGNSFLTCAPAACRASLTAPANGQLSYDSASPVTGTKATLSCTDGYTLQGAANSVCQATGDPAWSPAIGSCQANPCSPNLTAPRAGAVSSTTGTTGSVSTWSCNDNYVLTGTATTQCQASGKWSTETPPTCTSSLVITKVPASVGVGLETTSIAVHPNAAPVEGLTLTISTSVGSVSPATLTFAKGSTNDLTFVLSAPAEHGTATITFAVSGADAGIFTAPATISIPVVSEELVGRCSSHKLVQYNSVDGDLISTSTSFTTATECIQQCSNTFACVEAIYQTSTHTCSFYKSLGTGHTANEDYVSARCLANCPELSKPTNGAVTPTNGYAGQTAAYSCNNGYTLDNPAAASITCLTTGKWSIEQPPVCKPNACPALVAPAHGAGEGLANAVTGSTASFTCEEGYSLTGASKLNCIATDSAVSKWDNDVPTCTANSCPDVKAPENGAVSSTTARTGETVIFTCSEGSQLVGVSALTCLKTGKYDGVEPKCYKYCPKLSALDHSTLTGNFTNAYYSNKVTFTCEDGYVLDTPAASTLTCSEKGEWSPAPPTSCDPIPCKDALQAPAHGSVTPADGKGVTYSLVTFKCDQGYKLTGYSYSQCLPDHSWTNTAPKCDPVQCKNFLADPENGKVSAYGGVTSDVRTYTCNAGYKLVGASVVECLPSSEWNVTTTPTCQPLPCPELSKPEFGSVSPSSGVTGTTAVYTCISGYTLNGTAQVLCSSNSKWSAGAPVCTPNPCPSLTAPRYGALSSTTGSTTSVVTVTCEEGFALTGASSLTCQADGAWSSQVGTCNPKQCTNKLAAPAHGSMKSSSTTQDGTGVTFDALTFSCDQGYTLVGAATTVCQRNQSWSAPAPVCNPNPCRSNLPVPIHGSVTPSATGVTGDVRKFQCAVGYKLVPKTGAAASSFVELTEDASLETTCGLDGNWTVPAVDCVPLPCPAFNAAPEHGQASNLTGVTGSTIIVTCDEGYYLADGINTIVCQVDSQWSGVLPVCSPKMCPSLESPLYGSVDNPKGWTGAVATYSCQQGYSASFVPASSSSTPKEDASTLQVTCLTNSTWSARVYCVPNACQPDWTILGNGSISALTGVTNTTINFLCNAGYTLVGQASSTCLPTGSWSNALPICQAKACPELLPIAKGSYSTNKGVTGDIVTASCDQGYHLANNHNGILVCQAAEDIGNRWNASIPSCLPNPCPSLTAPANGSVDRVEGVTGSVSTFTCANTHRLVGEAFLHCLPTGAWDNKPPTCQDLCDGVSCEVHGRCVLGKCECRDGYFGERCEHRPIVHSWNISSWTECSVPCGSGLQERTVTCIGVGDETLAYGDEKCLNANNTDNPRPETSRVCNTQRCVKYSWSSGPWSECSKPCGAGLNNRTVACVGDDSQAYPDDKCTNAGDKPSSTQDCNTDACITYDWKFGEWSDCSVTCGGGVKKRDVVCFGSNNQNAADSFCNATTRPDNVQACNFDKCPVYDWVVGDYSACSATCGGGVKTRTVVCKDDSGVVAASEDKCTKTKPETEEKCNVQICVTFSWTVGDWSACSLKCGSGTRSRLVQCKGSDDSLPSDTSVCKEEKPASIESCNTAACVAGHWEPTDWSKCSVTCGNGIQTRTIGCAGTDDDPQCSLAGPQPASQQICQLDPCITFSWEKSTEWTDCSNVCGGGTQVLTARCKGSNGQYYADENCVAAGVGAKPEETRACNTAPCRVDSWFAGEWSSECSKPCGGGIRTRSVICRGSDGSTRPDSDCSKAGDKPETELACNTQRCIIYSWKLGEWSTCSKTCETGTQTRTVDCTDDESVVYPVSVCQSKLDGPVPTSQQSCNSQKCVPGAWQSGDWQACNKECGGGIQRREITCAGTNDDPNCINAGTKPEDSRPCNTDSCITYSWKVGEFGDCDLTCGGGQSKRSVVCWGSNNKEAADVMCTDTKPATSQACNTQKCTVYSWAEGEWSACSKVCAGGTRTRQLACQGDDGKTYPFDKCAATTPAPATVDACNVFACPVWYTADWDSKCSVPCGGGVQLRDVFCQNHEGKFISDDECKNAGPKPDSSKPCNTFTCPKWVEGDWSICSASCNGGTQTRSVTCKSDTQVFEESLCGDNKPASTRACNSFPCDIKASWKVGPWGSCSKECGQGGGVRTRQVVCYTPTNPKVVEADCLLDANDGPKPATQSACNIFACGDAAASISFCVDSTYLQGKDSSALNTLIRTDVARAAQISVNRVRVEHTNAVLGQVNVTVLPSVDNDVKTPQQVLRTLRGQSDNPWSLFHRGVVTSGHNINCDIRGYLFGYCADGSYDVTNSGSCDAGGDAKVDTPQKVAASDDIPSKHSGPGVHALRDRLDDLSNIKEKHFGPNGQPFPVVHELLNHQGPVVGAVNEVVTEVDKLDPNNPNCKKPQKPKKPSLRVAKLRSNKLTPSAPAKK